MLKAIAIVLALIVAGILVLAAAKPDTFQVERSIDIDAPAEKIFPLINDFHKWPLWSPWEKMDPAMKKSITGPAEGTGTVYEWSGNNKVGRGRMEIAESTPPSRVAIELAFLEPFEAHNLAEFDLQPSGGTTHVRWKMSGPSPFLSKIMQVFCDMDKLIGKDFETGLVNMKAAAERPS